MIRRVVIENFQSHKHTALELVDGVNVLTGQSDSGKTAVLRAIRWVAENRPSGDEFRSHWGGDTLVQLTLDNGVVVERRKGKGVNDYRIYFPKDKSDIVLSAMGQDVPEPVREALGFTDLNFQLQMDAPFLLSESPGEVARQLNEVADISKIDSSLANVNRMIRDNKSTLIAKGQEASQLEAELAGFRSLDKQLKAVDLLVERERRADEMEKMAGRGGQLVEGYEMLSVRLDRLPGEGAERKLKDVTMLFQTAEEKEAQVARMEKSVGALLSLRQQLKALPSSSLGPRLETLLTLLRRAEEKEESAEDAERQVVLFGEKRDGLASFNLSVKQLEKQWHEQMPNVCPLCEQAIKQG